ncbi:MAG: hypothetical protein JO115_02520, partial [Pseudonocardiales bacterium]|nr:hypothetical protein [Pseudonocardiales bacterium]
MRAGLAPVTGLNPGASKSASDLQGWVVWLERALAPAWRVDEWDAANWLFTGDVTNPRTSVWKCTTAACDAVMKARGQRCQACEAALGASDLSPSVFAATYVPVRRAAFPGTASGRCIVGADATPCVFAAFTHGLCQSHYGLWIRYQRQHPGAGLEQWAQTVARPRTAPVNGCLVGGCGEALQSGLGLCCYHHRKWHCQLGRLPGGWEDRRVARSEVGGAGAGDHRCAVLQGVSLPGGDHQPR